MNVSNIRCWVNFSNTTYLWQWNKFSKLFYINIRVHRCFEAFSEKKIGGPLVCVHGSLLVHYHFGYFSSIMFASCFFFIFFRVDIFIELFAHFLPDKTNPSIQLDDKDFYVLFWLSYCTFYSYCVWLRNLTIVFVQIYGSSAFSHLWELCLCWS